MIRGTDKARGVQAARSIWLSPFKFGLSHTYRALRDQWQGNQINLGGICRAPFRPRRGRRGRRQRAWRCSSASKVLMFI